MKYIMVILWIITGNQNGGHNGSYNVTSQKHYGPVFDTYKLCSDRAKELKKTGRYDPYDQHYTSTDEKKYYRSITFIDWNCVPYGGPETGSKEDTAKYSEYDWD